MEERNQRDFNLRKGRFLGFGGIEGEDEKKKLPNDENGRNPRNRGLC